jgi:hypothetical protein
VRRAHPLRIHDETRGGHPRHRPPGDQRRRGQYGTSGWSYDHWHPELYPPGLPARDRLARYTQSFTTAELNSSFYRWPAPAAFASWRRRLPEGFRLRSRHRAA